MTTETKKLGVGDDVSFYHAERMREGKVLEVMADGKLRIKDTHGYIYRYLPENVVAVGQQPPMNPSPVPAAATPAQPKESQTTKEPQNNNNNQSQETMAKKKEAAAKAAPAKTAAATTGDAAQIKKVMALSCKKHQRIFLLAQSGCDKGQIMKLAGCNAGEISNAKKMYAESKEKTAAANSLLS